MLYKKKAFKNEGKRERERARMGGGVGGGGGTSTKLFSVFGGTNRKNLSYVIFEN